ncbi:hypothetical protein T459_04479 [Capsicum annuum]|uniref:Uncharacterized protein n=1 Tax=Capsicum annuum TaxID=4072 RepID=A0A2G3A545_CAPAN|nr:hypothetical protein T459_04479 [Capsicum annuum]
MPKSLNVYVTTASNTEESSWGTYCPGMDPPPPSEYLTCLGDLYSVAWMEVSESHNLNKETIKQQYEKVKERTSNFNNYNVWSHVMEYGSKEIKPKKVYLYQGFDPATVNLPANKIDFARLEVFASLSVQVPKASANSRKSLTPLFYAYLGIVAGRNFILQLPDD